MKTLLLATALITLGTDASAAPYNFMERNQFGNQNTYEPRPAPTYEPAPRVVYVPTYPERTASTPSHPLDSGFRDARGSAGGLFTKPAHKNGLGE